jgi:phosphonate transport system permease protein
MYFPKFIPIPKETHVRRVWAAWLIEMFVWAYLSMIGVRILFGHFFLAFVERIVFSGFSWSPVVKILTHFGESQYFSLSWKQVVLTAVLGACIGLGVATTKKGFGAWLASLSHLKVVDPQQQIQIKQHWSFAKLIGWVLVALTFLTGWLMSEIEPSKLFDPEGLRGAGRMYAQLACGLPALHRFGVFEWFDIPCRPSSSSFIGSMLVELTRTIYMAFMATVFSVPVAFLLSFFSSYNLMRRKKRLRLVYGVLRFLINLIRSIEPLVWAILLSVWLGIGPFPGMMALAIHSVSSLVKQYSEAIESLDSGPIEALESTGASLGAIAWHGVVPQVILHFLSYTMYRWDINVRMATVIGLVGGGGIGSRIIQEQGLGNWVHVGTIAFFIFMVVWVMDFVSTRVRAAIK